MEVNNQELNDVQDNKIVKNVAMVAFSNVLTILAGVLVGFLIPKIMGIEDYGYYKIYTLYIGYVGFFHFGIIDGIYLFFAGRSYDSLDREKFRFFTRFLFVTQGIITIIVTIIALCFINFNYGFIFLFVALYLFSNNITNYYQFVSQMTFRFKELTIMNIIRSFLLSISVLGLFVGYKWLNFGLIHYQLYLMIFTVINYLLTFGYVILYRDISFGKVSKFKEQKKLLKELISLGFPLLLANIIGNLILNIDRQFVSILFDTEVYAVYAFAYNMLSLVTTAIAAISTVLYPSLKSKNEDDLKKSYSNLSGIMLIIVSFCLLAYFPLVLIINWFLPQYNESLKIFQVIFPGLLFNTAVTVVMTNYYKSLGLVKNYFIKSIIILALSAGVNFLAYIIFKSPIAISAASVVVMVFWYLLTEFTLIRRWKFNFITNLVYVLLIAIGFYAITFLIKNVYIGGISYLIYFCIMTFLFERKNFIKMIKRKIF